MGKLLIKGARIIDPANNLDAQRDLLIEHGKIIKIEKSIKPDGAELLNASKKIVIPGLIDMHTHLRQPGREDEESILSALHAAAKGGFTAVTAMPNTEPPCDNETVVEFILSLSDKAKLIKVYPVGAITKGLKGEQLADIGSLAKAGAIAISNDGNPTETAGLMRRVLEYSKMWSMPVIAHCEDVSLSSGGVMNEGYASTRLGLKGLPRISESIQAARNIQLAQYTKARLHLAHISTKEALQFIREAKQKSLNITCETCPHYWTLTDEDVQSYNTLLKMNPPLRTKDDVEAVKDALKDGTIDAIATDHAPHSSWEKVSTFDSAPFGVIGLETALSLAITYLVQPGILSLSGLVERMSLGPARILNVAGGTLSPGGDADITIIDLNNEWIVDKDAFLSKSKNSPFIGWRLKGGVDYTICKGRVVYKR